MRTIDPHRYVALHPATYPSAAKLRLEALSGPIDWLTVEAKMPILAQQITLSALEIGKLIEQACANDARGTNVVPHLLVTLDAIHAELTELQRRLR